MLSVYIPVAHVHNLCCVGLVFMLNSQSLGHCRGLGLWPTTTLKVEGPDEAVGCILHMLFHLVGHIIVCLLCRLLSTAHCNHP